MEMVADGRIWFGETGGNAPRVKKFLTEVQAGLVPSTLWLHQEVGSNGRAKSEVVELFPGETPFSTPKPEALIQRILHIATNPNDLILDSFLGSGTTAAVAHKMGRRWIGIEMGEHAATHCLPRLQKVIDGEQGGISKAVGWNGGGGFRLMRLGAPVFDARGRIHPDVRYATLAAFVWQQETGTSLAPMAAQTGTPYLGTHYTFDSCSRNEDGGFEPFLLKNSGELDSSTIPAQTEVLRTGLAIYLLFNGILGDKRPASGNVLTQAVLDALLALHAQMHSAPSIPLLVFGEACRLGATRLKLANVTFKHIPYDVKAR